MPILVKQGFTRPADPTDGFDPEARYQMVPLGQTRVVAAQTGDFEAEMKFTSPNISSMFNFHVVRQTAPSSRSLPHPNLLVNHVVLPSNSIVEFMLRGDRIGSTVLEGRDLPGLGAPPLLPDFKPEVAVKEPGKRFVAVCYVFDTVNTDKGRRTDFAGVLTEVSRIFETQSNFSIVHLGSRPGLTITLPSTSGNLFDLVDPDLINRLIDHFNASFPGVFAQTNFVMFVTAVPLKVIRRRPLAIQLNYRRKSDGLTYSTLFVGPTQNTDRAALQRTIAHEVGHTFGLLHSPKFQPDGPTPGVLPDPDVLPFFMHNLMFPSDLIQGLRLTRSQIELIHSFVPPFRDLEI